MQCIIPSVSPSSDDIRIVPFPSSIWTSGATIANFSFTIYKKKRFKILICITKYHKKSRPFFHKGSYFPLPLERGQVVLRYLGASRKAVGIHPTFHAHIPSPCLTTDRGSDKTSSKWGTENSDWLLVFCSSLQIRYWAKYITCFILVSITTLY